MGYEWRIFQELNFNIQEDKLQYFKNWLNEIKSEKANLESRSDIYIVFKNLNEGQKHNFGLKFRDIKIKKKKEIIEINKLELKVRQSVQELKYEQWDKVMKTKISQPLQVPFIKVYDEEQLPIQDPNKKIEEFKIDLDEKSKWENPKDNKKFTRIHINLTQEQTDFLHKEIVKSLKSLNYNFSPTKKLEFSALINSIEQSNQFEMILLKKYRFIGGSFFHEQTYSSMNFITNLSYQRKFFMSYCIEGSQQLDDTDSVQNKEKLHKKMTEPKFMGYAEACSRQIVN